MVTCLCGRETADASGLWRCSRCGRAFHLPLRYEGDFEIVSGDLTQRYRNYLGWLLLVPLLLQWLVAYWIVDERAGVFFLLPSIVLLMSAYGFSDELRAVPLIPNYRPVIVGFLLFEAGSWIGAFQPWSTGLVVAGLGLASVLAGIAMSLGSARPQIRYPFLVLDAWRVLFRRPKTVPAKDVAPLLPKAVMLLRSFPADLWPVEQVDMEFGHDRILFTATLEETVRHFAREAGLDLVKLGGESRSEGATAVASDDEYWQDVARQMIEHRPALIMVPGGTPGLAWELEHLVRSGVFPGNVTVCFPKLPAKELDEIWNAFRAISVGLGVPLPALPPDREWHPLAACFEPHDSRWIAVAVSSWTTGPCRRAYWYALRRCLAKTPRQAEKASASLLTM